MTISKPSLPIESRGTQRNALSLLPYCLTDWERPCLPSTRLARPGRRAMRLLRGAMPRPPCGRMDPAFRGVAFQALLQRIHQVDHVTGFLRMLLDLDRLAGSLAAHQGFQRVLIFILEFRRIEMRGLGVEDVARELDHVFRYSR